MEISFAADPAADESSAAREVESQNNVEKNTEHSVGNISPSSSSPTINAEESNEISDVKEQTEVEPIGVVPMEVEEPSAGGSANVPEAHPVLAKHPTPSQQLVSQQVHPSGSSTQQSSSVQKNLKVEDALAYLDQVKMAFKDKPHIYNEFLEIMKNFKSHSLTTPGVISRVKNLFRGYNKLILGFNTFLPEGEGHKIELTPEEEALTAPGDDLSENEQQQQHLDPAQPPTPGNASTGSLVDHAHERQVPPAVLVPAASSEETASAAGSSLTPVAANDAGAKPPQHVQQQHAIQYVTTIRNRFSNEPDTYRQFLKILHTYQKEQKGIKEVLEQVSHLFADHPDLLMEFTYFLPDAVQDQAKERLNRAVREAEARRSHMLHTQQSGQQDGGASSSGKNKRPRQADGGPGSGPARTGKVRSVEMAGRPTPVNVNVNGQVMQNTPTAAGLSSFQNRMGNAVDMQGSKGNKGSNAAANKRRAADGSSSMPSSSNPRDNGGVVMSMAAAPISNSQAMARVHNLSVERKFFDVVKDILSSSSRDSWGEFVKCLELFGNDALSRKDMFTLVQELFGPNNQVLFEEFKALLFRKTAYDSSASDMYYAIPLSEIDFSQCLKCTPSYRGLPKDYPKPLCSDRGVLETAVLNDQWVSIPIGSEESYSFKHMRKNQYEEALFKCEDDRFEIDMLIDTNMSTIRMLEPLNEEIQHIRQMEEKDGGQPRFNFQLEKRHLSTIHLNCITRLYGDCATEILELLRKNPIGAIPIILKRLKQKDLEWRKARQEMNKTWKDVLATNSERSFDHRSFYYRVQDKRSYNARHLVNDIKVTGCAPDTSTPAELVPMCITCPVPNSHPMLALCGADLQPCHLMMDFENEGRGVHRDMYRIFCHATEMSNMNSTDKERIAALWRDFMRVFFNFPVHFMYDGMSARDGTESSSPDSSRGGSVPIDIDPAWQVGTVVVTIYGVGKIAGYRAEDGMHSVRLPFGIAFMRSASIQGSEELSIPALSAIGVTKDAAGNDVILNGISTTGQDGEPTVKKPQQLFYGTQMCYVFLRLYHTIYVRLLAARRLATENMNKHSVGNSHKYEDTTDDDLLGARATGNSLLKGSTRADAYSSLIAQIMAMVDGTIDATKFEDTCRQILGNKSFFLYTIDKILQQALKCLQAMANDEIVTKLVGIFLYHRGRNPEAGTLPSLYLAHVAYCLSNTMEEVYRLQYVTSAIGETIGSSAVLCQFIGILTFDPTAIAPGDTGPMAIATPRGVQTPMGAGTSGFGVSAGSGGHDSASKAPQLVLPDAEEDDDEEEASDDEMDVAPVEDNDGAAVVAASRNIRTVKTGRAQRLGLAADIIADADGADNEEEEEQGDAAEGDDGNNNGSDGDNNDDGSRGGRLSKGNSNRNVAGSSKNKEDRNNRSARPSNQGGALKLTDPVDVAVDTAGSSKSSRRSAGGGGTAPSGGNSGAQSAASSGTNGNAKEEPGGTSASSRRRNR